MRAEEFIGVLNDRGFAPKAHGRSKWQSRCPAHEDSRPSLSISEAADGRVLLHCHAGCAAKAVCTALGIATRDLFPVEKRNGKPKPEIVATYDYQDEAGKLLFQVVRFDPKGFRQRRPNPSVADKWTWSVKGVRRVPFRLPQVIAAIMNRRPVFIAEGEKDVLALEEAGFCATCNPGGAGKWLPEYAKHFEGADVVVIADRDEPGRKHGQQVAEMLHGVEKSVRVVELPDVNGKTVKDAADYFAAGGQAADLDDLSEDAPLWTPPSEPNSQPSETRHLNAGATAGDSDVRGRIVAVLTDRNSNAREQRKSIAATVVDGLRERGFFYHDAELKSFDTAMFFDRQRRQLVRIRCDAFVAWLADWTAINRADNLFKAVLAEVETAALSDERSTPIRPEAYFATRNGRVYLSNGDAELCRISPGKVEMLPNGTDNVLFAAGYTLRPWRRTVSKDPFKTCRLFADIQTTEPHISLLVLLWSFSLPTAPRSKPPLCLYGEIGSGKTRLALGIAELYGLPPVAAKVEEKLEGDFWPMLDAGGLLTLDNADTRTKWLPDAVATAATNGCAARRRLYTDRETVTLHARAWLVITTANPTFASDSGLADRLLVARLRRREGTTSDSALSEEIEANRDAGLTFIANMLASALADERSTPEGLNQRHPDFAAFAVRIGRALGREREAIAALTAAEADKARFCLENDIIGAALLTALADGRTLEGTSENIGQILAERDKSIAEISTRSIGRRIAGLWPHLEAHFDASRKQVQRVWNFRFRRRDVSL